MSEGNNKSAESDAVSTGSPVDADSEYKFRRTKNISPHDQLSMMSKIEKLVLAKWGGVSSSEETNIPPEKKVYLDKLKFLQRALIIYAHWHIDSFDEIPSEQALLNVARYITPPMGEGFEHFAHGMDTWTYRHEFWWLGMAAHEKEKELPRLPSKEIDDASLKVSPTDVPPVKVKRQPSSNLLSGIDGIATAYRSGLGGAPGGYIQARARQFGRHLRDYASWFVEEHDKNPTLNHISRVAKAMDKLGYSRLGQNVGVNEFQLLFSACKDSAQEP